MKIVAETVVAWHKPGASGAEPHPVTVQRLAEDRCKWCVRFCGQGKYFVNDLELLAYLKYRFGFRGGIVL